MGRNSLAKTFQGDLKGTSRGEMLQVMTTTPGSAAYTAIEQVQGTLGGRQGSFVLAHYGVMQDGDNRLTLEVVPDSGTGDLAGLAGKMALSFEDGGHQYDMEYSLG